MSFHDNYIRTNKWYHLYSEFEMQASYTIQTDIVGFVFEDANVKLTIMGELTAKTGFLFGASGPCVDTVSSREGSCFHDCLYYISQQGGFDDARDNNKVRKRSDELIRDLCLKNGMLKIRAHTWYRTLRLLGESSWNDKD